MIKSNDILPNKTAVLQWMTEDQDQPLLLTIMQFFLRHNVHSHEDDAEAAELQAQPGGLQVSRNVWIHLGCSLHVLTDKSGRAIRVYC